MIKIAICFSGHLRNYEECFPSIKNKLLDKYDCDVFISTYDTTINIQNKVINLYNPKKIIFNNENDVKNIVNNNKILCTKFLQIAVDKDEHIYNDKKYTINECFDYKNINSNDLKEHKIHTEILCQFFGIYDVSKMCEEYILENNIKYDYILRVRLDNTIIGEIIFDNFEENTITVNCIQKYSHSIKLQDHFFMATPNTYFKISNLYNELPQIINFINNNKCWLPGSGYPETLLLIHIILNNIKIKTTNKKFLCFKKV